MKNIGVLIFFFGLMLAAMAQDAPKPTGGWLKRRCEAHKAKHALRIERKYARRDGQERFLVNETAVTLARSQDLHQANTPFAGVGIVVGRGFYAQGGAATRICRVSGGYNYLLGAETTTHNPRIEGSYTYLRNIKNFGKKGKWNVRAGGTLQGLGNFRINPSLGNSSVALEAGGILAADMRITRDFSFRKKPNYRFDYHLRVPLAAYLWQLPIYSLSGFASPAATLRPLGSFSRFTSEIGISRPLSRKGNNRVRFAYTWDLYHIADELHPVTVTNSLLSIAWWIRL